ncbi:hypothetical protein N7478_012486 [Penicillium angulare]|uniref:uncharacterized protein n=1 Tax=Penicillium angulare TaxID=116970 RepID=UPI002541CABC|nr:uncharacterized protein N7478_012486 [Penicillium angulare]KAJ5259505.1 hypothetical protein N7478_012486 [Penicillium angulare]
MSLTRGHSCALCQQRKVRCDQQKPCTNCIRAHVECKIVPPQPARRKKRKLQEDDLVERLRRYEELMTRNGVDFCSIRDDKESRDESGNVSTEVPKPSPGADTPSGLSRRRGEGRKLTSRHIIQYQTTDDLLHGSDEDEDERPTIHHAFDTMFENNDGFPFMVGGSPARITHLHPSPIHIFQLWQVYLNNVNPLLKISHVPTLQNQIVGAGADLSNISKPLEALMFSIYLISVTSMTKENVESTFDESKDTLLSKYHGATQRSLVNAGFMRSSDLMTLQAHLLYLLSIAIYVDPRSLFCLIGIAVRVATRLGLHRDGAQFGLSPFETEQRKRIWWQLAILDKRMAEMTGSAITALSSSKTDCRLPLNVNDTDLHKQSKEPPVPSTGSTEMLFCLTRVELLIAAAPSSMRPDPSISRNRYGKDGPVATPSSYTHKKASQPSFRGLDDYCSYIESTYLKHCDPKIPIQLFTLMTGRASLYKLRVVDFMCRGISTSEMLEKDRDDLFLFAIQTIECDDVIYNTESLRGFRWYTHYQAPMPAFVFLMNELRQRTTGLLCERAWRAICSNHQNRGLDRNLRSPMHTVFGQAMLKAWDAREQAELQNGKILETPDLITLLRRAYKSKRNVSHAQAPPSPPHPSGSNDLPRSGQLGANTDTQTSKAGNSDGEGQFPTPRTTFDDNMVFPSLDGLSDMYGSGIMGYEDTDWSYLIPSGVFGGFFGDPI